MNESEHVPQCNSNWRHPSTATDVPLTSNQNDFTTKLTRCAVFSTIPSIWKRKQLSIIGF